MLGLAITALAVVVILISWIYKRFMEVRFFLTKTVFQSARPTACDSRAERASRLTLRFHPRLIANAPSSGPSACTGFFVCVSFKILCMNHVYQYLICPSINFMMIANIL